jgi:hypothetical protein
MLITQVVQALYIHTFVSGSPQLFYIHGIANAQIIRLQTLTAYMLRINKTFKKDLTPKTLHNKEPTYKAVT